MTWPRAAHSGHSQPRSCGSCAGPVWVHPIPKRIAMGAVCGFRHRSQRTSMSARPASLMPGSRRHASAHRSALSHGHYGRSLTLLWWWRKRAVRAPEGILTDGGATVACCAAPLGNACFRSVTRRPRRKEIGREAVRTRGARLDRSRYDVARMAPDDAPRFFVRPIRSGRFVRLPPRSRTCCFVPLSKRPREALQRASS